jgi:hypothetical protein
MLKKRSSYDKTLFLVNQYVELIVFDPDRGKIGLTSRIREAEDERILIYWPKSRKNEKYQFKGIRFAVFQCLVGNEVVSFKITITAEMLQGFELGVMRFSPPRFVEGIEQKRVYQRIARKMLLRYRVLSDEGFSDTLHEGTTLNLSIGGLEFSSVEKMEPGTEIESHFSMEYVDFSGIRSEIVRRSDSPRHKDLEFVYAVKFLSMFERERISLNQLLLKTGPRTLEPTVKSDTPVPLV